MKKKQTEPTEIITLQDLKDPKILSDKIEEFYLTSKSFPRTPHHLYKFLGVDFFTVMELEVDPEIKRIFDITRGNLYTEIIDFGFMTDKSFAKYYLDRYPENSGNISISNGTTVVINLDNTPGYDLEDLD